VLSDERMVKFAEVQADHGKRMEGVPHLTVRSRPSTPRSRRSTPRSRLSKTIWMHPTLV
jgi:hypothetical protein